MLQFMSNWNQCVSYVAVEQNVSTESLIAFFIKIIGVIQPNFYQLCFHIKVIVSMKVVIPWWLQTIFDSRLQFSTLNYVILSPLNFMLKETPRSTWCIIKSMNKCPERAEKRKYVWRVVIKQRRYTIREKRRGFISLPNLILLLKGRNSNILGSNCFKPLPMTVYFPCVPHK